MKTTKQYTGHHNTKMPDGKTLVEWLTPTIQDECQHYGIPMPSPGQIAVVISAMRMHTVVVHAAGYDTSELRKPDQVTEYWPLESSVGRYFRDAARVTLDSLREGQKV
jgi:hypothetical protein